MQEKNSKLSFNHNTDFLKLIAALTMLADHIGKVFFKDVILLQIIGRISFPLFAYCISVGAIYTKDMQKYLLRVAVFALISQPFYILAFIPDISGLGALLTVSKSYPNILFTLLTGLAIIYGIKLKNIGVITAVAVFAAFAPLDYGVYGVMMIVGFYVLRRNEYYSLMFATALISLQFFLKDNMEWHGYRFGLNAFGLISLLLIFFDIGKGFGVNKYIYYIFYPVHLFLIFIFQVL